MKKSRKILLGQKLKIYTDHKNIARKNFNTDWVLWWRLILENFVPDIEYILDNKNITAGALSLFPLNINQETTHESTYKTETMSELYDIDKLIDGKFPLPFKLIVRYHW